MNIFLGFEKESGEEVSISLTHTFITGITQSGKTELVKALAERVKGLGFTVLIVDVKKQPTGARDFNNLGYEIPIYLKESTDSLTLKSLLETEGKFRLSYQFPELIRASEKANSFQQVLSNIESLLQKPIHPVRKDKLEVLRLLMQRLIQEFSQVQISKILELTEGEVNVMDLTPYSEAFKQMVVKSIAEYIRQNVTKIVLVSDECHIHIPQGYSSASKQAVTWLIKEGAGSQQYVFLVDQTVTEIDKRPVKQMDNWILGRQRELNEAQRAYRQLPFKAGITVEDIMRLPMGFFYISTYQWVKQAYVQPLWVPQDVALEIAKGTLSSDSSEVQRYKPSYKPPSVSPIFESPQITLDGKTEETYTSESIRSKFSELVKRVEHLEGVIGK